MSLYLDIDWSWNSLFSIKNSEWSKTRFIRRWRRGDLEWLENSSFVSTRDYWRCAYCAHEIGVINRYLVHPFSLGTTLARSTIVFSNFFVALAISSAMSGTYKSIQAIRSYNFTDQWEFSGSIFPAVFSLSLATHLSFYPALLLPPIVTLLYRSSATSQSKSTVIAAIIAYSLHQSLVLVLSNWLTGSWDFLFSVYGVM